MKSISLKYISITLVILIAYLNTILIVIPGTSWTLFRCIIPFLILLLIPDYKIEFLKILLFALLILTYSYIISYLPFNRFQSFDINFVLHYILVPFCFFLVKILVDIIGVKSFYTILKNIHILMLVLGLLQFFLGGIYPNTQDRLPMVNIFFWNENEFCATLAIFLPIFFLTEKKNLYNLIVTLLTLFFIFYSDARLLIIGLVIFFGMYSLTKINLYKYKTLWYLILFSSITIGFIYLQDLEIFDKNTIYDIFFDSIRRIITLDDYEGIGSVITRVNAYIWGMEELLETYMFGIGPGNSIQVMVENTPLKMEDFAAKSFHNILLQYCIELGVIGIIIIWFLLKTIQKIIKQSPNDKVLISSFYLASIIFTTILSGAFSNYSFIFIFAFSLFYLKTIKVT